jgi:transcriptional regulator with XRE-family HTH domain
VSLRERIILDLTMRGGDALIELRQQAGLRREDIAAGIHRSFDTVSTWERVRNKPIKNTDILRLAEYLEPKINDWPKASKLSSPHPTYIFPYPYERRRRLPQLAAA